VEENEPGSGIKQPIARRHGHATGMGRRTPPPREPIRAALVNEILKPKRSPMKPFERISNPREIRRRLRLNQQDFWSRIGVTQSGGSRYESGRTMPKPVRELLRLVHIEGIQLAKARGKDFEVVSYLKNANPRLYRKLTKAALKKNGGKKN
jgi:DNA-binding transcriptional regulator YiaG